MGTAFFKNIIALAGRAAVIAMPLAALCVGAETAFVGGILPLEPEAPTDGTCAVADADARPVVSAVVSAWETNAGLEAAVIISGFDSNDATSPDSPTSLWW